MPKGGNLTSIGPKGFDFPRLKQMSSDICFFCAVAKAQARAYDVDAEERGEGYGNVHRGV